MLLTSFSFSLLALPPPLAVALFRALLEFTLPCLLIALSLLKLLLAVALFGALLKLSYSLFTFTLLIFSLLLLIKLQLKIIFYLFVNCHYIRIFGLKDTLTPDGEGGGWDST